MLSFNISLVKNRSVVLLSTDLIQLWYSWKNLQQEIMIFAYLQSTENVPFVLARGILQYQTVTDLLKSVIERPGRLSQYRSVRTKFWWDQMHALTTNTFGLSLFFAFFCTLFHALKSQMGHSFCLCFLSCSTSYWAAQTLTANDMVRVWRRRFSLPVPLLLLNYDKPNEVLQWLRVCDDWSYDE